MYPIFKNWNSCWIKRQKRNSYEMLAYDTEWGKRVKEVQNSFFIGPSFSLNCFDYGTGTNLLSLYKCKKPARLSFNLSRNRFKTMEPIIYKATRVYTGNKDDVPRKVLLPHSWWNLLPFPVWSYSKIRR